MKVRGLILMILLSFEAFHVEAQVEAFATIRVNRTSVYPEQPIKVSIAVHTATWFTNPLDFDNIQIANSFVIPFKRTLSSMKEIRGKKYATLEFYYIVYPYQSGSYEIPPINIIAETPAVGDYKGQQVTLTTKRKNFTVKPEPKDFEGDRWFVAKNVTIKEKWDRSLDNLKVGDVIERTVTIRAQGTLPNFIPELQFEDPDFGSVYPKNADLVDRRDDKDSNGTRIEKVVYLLEKEGEFRLSPIRIDWYNPYSGRSLYRELAAVNLQIADNPDLGIVKTLKDSLSMGNVLQGDDLSQEDEVSIFGLKLWQFVSILAILLVLVFYALRFTIYITKRVKRRRQLYLASEAYYFKQIRTGVSNVDIINMTYRWWDIVRIKYALSVTIDEAMVNHGTSELATLWKELESDVFSQDDQQIEKSIYHSLGQFRQNILTEVYNGSNSINEGQKPW